METRFITFFVLSTKFSVMYCTLCCSYLIAYFNYTYNINSKSIYLCIYLLRNASESVLMAFVYKVCLRGQEDTYSQLSARLCQVI